MSQAYTTYTTSISSTLNVVSVKVPA